MSISFAYERNHTASIIIGHVEQKSAIKTSMFLQNIFMISSIYFATAVQTDNYSLSAVACLTVDILTRYQTQYMYLLHSSHDQGKIQR
jgi:hypothetical protein